MAARLKAVSVALQTGAITEREAAAEISKILMDDAILLPIADKPNTP